MAAPRRIIVATIVAITVLACDVQGRPRKDNGVPSVSEWEDMFTPANPVIHTEYGWISGVHEDGIIAYYGIPFAAPPVGANRLRMPQPHDQWTGTRECHEDKFTFICPQFHITKKIVLGQEDCLYMNIFMPDKTPPEGGWPVMFWLFGGAWVLGDGFEFGFYRGKNLAKKHNVIVVEFNYRLGNLGFAAIKELEKENPYGSTGNYGTQDQQFALQFVNRNINKFYGDNTRVMIFGESAGAFSVCWHLVSEISRPLFHAAIMESGTCDSAEFFIPYERAIELSENVIEFVKCNGTIDVVECLRTVDYKDFQLVFSKYPAPSPGHPIPPLAPLITAGVAIDGKKQGLLKRPLDLIKEGRFAKVPLIIGTNKDEGTLFTLAMPSVVNGSKFPPDEADFELALQHFFNETTVSGIKELYPADPEKHQTARIALILRDFFFLCATRRIADQFHKHNVPVYMYQFRHVLKHWVDYDLLQDYHTLELPFVFDNQWPPLLHEFNEDDKEMAAIFTNYWTNLAKYADPNMNSTNFRFWPKYDTKNRTNIVMAIPDSLNQDLGGDVCDFWDTHYPTYYFDH